MADRASRAAAGETPRWVKVFGLVALVLVILVVVLLLVGGNHGPGRHVGGSTPHSDVAQHQRSSGGHG